MYTIDTFSLTNLQTVIYAIVDCRIDRLHLNDVSLIFKRDAL